MLLRCQSNVLLPTVSHSEGADAHQQPRLLHEHADDSEVRREPQRRLTTKALQVSETAHANQTEQALDFLLTGVQPR